MNGQVSRVGGVGVGEVRAPKVLEVEARKTEGHDALLRLIKGQRPVEDSKFDSLAPRWLVQEVKLLTGNTIRQEHTRKAGSWCKVVE